jgi:hypothetical protein
VQLINDPALDLFIDQVTLGDAEDLALLRELSIVLDQLTEEETILGGDILRIGWDHEEEQSVALNMAKEA